MNRFTKETDLLIDSIAALNGRFAPTLSKEGHLILKRLIRFSVVGPQLQILIVVAQFDPFTRPAANTLLLRLGELTEEKCLVGQLGCHIPALQLIIVLRIHVLDVRPAYFEVIGDLHLRIRPSHPEIFSTFTKLIGHANRDLVQVLIAARDRRFEEQASGQGFERIVREPHLRCRLQDDRRLIAIPHEDLDLLAVFYQTFHPADLVRP